MGSSNRAAAVVAAIVLPLLLHLGEATAGGEASLVTINVPATANIFGAGKSAPPAGAGGVGQPPPGYALPPGGSRELTFSSVTGRITCCKTAAQPPYNGPEGLGSGTNLSGVPGISGVQSSRAMFLAAVFLGPGAPSGTVSTNTGTQTPVLGQVFYVGTGKSGGKPVAFGVPAGATRLFLGIADGFSFRGAPGYYGDNAGSFSATFTVRTRSVPQPVEGRLGVEYSVPPRFGKTRNGMIEYHDRPAEIHPSRFEVRVTLTRSDGNPCVGGDKLAVAAASDPVRVGVDPKHPCRFTLLFKEEGRFPVRFALTSGRKTFTAKGTIVVQDWLIVGLGDSNGSGEGTPDVEGLVNPRWQESRCHRSANSYQAQTALAIENHDERTSVTFVHLACSGADISHLLGPYEGIEKGPGLLPAQIKEMERLVGDREIDAIVVSIGVNDLRFGSLVTHCLRWVECQRRQFKAAPKPQNLNVFINQTLKQLPRRFAELAAALRPSLVPQRVYVNEYFDSTRDENADICDPLIDGPGGLDFDRREAAWANVWVLSRLNRAVQAAAAANRWRYVGGAQRAFAEHGYCSTDSWIVPLTSSLLQQSNLEGTLHATVRGNTESARFATAKLVADFYRGTKPRNPKP